MLSNRKLTYSKVYVDSEQRLPNSNSSSDFIIELHEFLETMPNPVMYVTEEIIPQSYYTTPEGFYQYFYLVLYNASDLSIVGYVKVDLTNQVYFAAQLSGSIVTLLNTATNDIQADLFTYNYDSDQRKLNITISNSAYSFKIPTDKELKAVPWDGQTLTDPMSINKLVGNYEEKAPTSMTWSSGLFNLNPCNSSYILSPELSDFHYSAPGGYSNNIIKQVNLMFNVGGVTVNSSAPLLNDYIDIDISNRSLKRLRFRITDARGKVINFHQNPISFSLLFVNL